MPRLVRIVLPCLLIAAVAIGTWQMLKRPPPVATWLHVEAPRQADAGGSFPVKVTLQSAIYASVRPPLLVGVDLHGYTRRHEWRNSISSAPPQPIGAPGTALEFNLDVPVRPDLRYVAILVYLSPTGKWKDHQDVASSLEIWYRPKPTGDFETALQPVAMYPQVPGTPIARADVRVLSIFIALGWLVCAWRAWRACLQPSSSGRHHRLLPLATLAAAAWELLPLERVLGELARTLVAALHWYNLRMGFQQLLTAGIAAVAVTVIYRILLRAETPGLRLQFLGLTLYAAVTLAGFLSLHLVDAIFARRIASVPFMQLVQLVAMLTALSGALLRMHHAGSQLRPASRPR